MRALLRACVVLGVAFAPAFSGAAAVSQEEVHELRAQIAALSERLAELEARAGIEEDRTGIEETAAPAPAPEPAPLPLPREDHWTDRVAFSGDFRYRWETIDQEGSDSRERHRIRARPALVAQVNETVRVGFGLATGGDSPVSANQTLGGGGASKPISLDRVEGTRQYPHPGRQIQATAAAPRRQQSPLGRRLAAGRLRRGLRQRQPLRHGDGDLARGRQPRRG